MQNFPKNCKWWNERSDVDAFYEAADLFLFTSKGNSHDKETMPLVIREALSWKTPSMIYNLPVYMGYFDKYSTIEYLSDDTQKNAYRIAEKLVLGHSAVLTPSSEKTFYTLDGERKLESLAYHDSTNENLHAFGDAAAQYFANFRLKELERADVTIESGDVFVDLGANIGMSSIYALSKGAAEIHCFEPDPAMVALIKKNVPSAKVYQRAIAENRENLELYHWPYNPVNVGPKYKCEGMPLKDVLNTVGKKIHYLKMDIEGFETAVFNSVTKEDCAQIDKLMVEYHSEHGLDEFCTVLRSKGFEISYIEQGYQSYIYARYSQGNAKMIDYGFASRWDLEQQTIYYSVQTKVDFPVIVAIKEYKSDATMWSSEMDSISPGCEYWMMPVSKNIHAYDSDPKFTGITFGIYRADTEEQLYEMPYVHRFINIPRVSLSNSIPLYLNYTEFFVDKKYSKWLDKKYELVVDVGANVGIFTYYMLVNENATHSVMVECDVKALKDLRRNFKLNTNTTLVPRALHHSNEPVTFYHSAENPVISSTLSPEQLKNHMAGVKGDKLHTVDTVTIKDLVDNYGTIDLLKIDIEGGEYDVIMRTDDSVFDHINHIMLECHFFEDNAPQRYLELTGKLRRLGYTIEEFMEHQENTRLGTSENIYAYRIGK
jgi:FkbM family methyltransferase